MFRKDKDLQERSQTLLKNKEIKQLKQDIVKQFPYFAEHEEALNSLLPNKCNLQCAKLANRTLLYSLEGTILFFDVEGRKNLFPTVYTLSLYPEILPSFSTWGPVSKFVLRGADFMIPGIANLHGIENLQSGGKCSLRIVGNPVPFAVGISLCSYSQLVGLSSRKGKAMNVFHSYGDLISPKTPPNLGFTPGEILPIEAVDSSSAGDYYEEEDEQKEEDALTGDEVETEDHNHDSENQENVESLQDKTDDTIPEAETNEREEEPGLTADDAKPTDITKENDEYLLQTLIITLKYFIKEKQLPMLVSTFWSLLQKYTPEESRSIDIKKTSFKKVADFLVIYCQHQLRLLSIQEDEQGVAKIVGVMREHPLFREYKVENIEAFKTEIARREQAKIPFVEAAAPSLSGSKASTGGSIQVLELYKVPKKLREIFADVLPTSTQYGDYLLLSEAREMVLEYMKRHQLEMPEKRSHVLITSDDPIYEYCSAASNKGGKASDPKPISVNPPAAVVDIDHTGLPSSFQPTEIREEETLIQQTSSLSVYDQWPTPAGKEIKLKIHKDGLKNVDELPDFPRLASTSSSSSSNPTHSLREVSRISGGSRVGGWGRDPSKPFRPINLPSSQPTTSISVPNNSTEYPSLSANDSSKQSLANQTSKKKSSEATNISRDEVTVHQLSKEEFFKGLVSKLTLYHAILSPDSSASPEIRSGTVPKVKILTEHRAGNKMVTVIRGLDHYPIDLAQFLKACQKKFACSVSLSSVPGIAKEKEVLVQGNYPLDVENYLIQQYGLPRIVTEVTLAKKKANKK